MSNLKLNIGN